MTGNASGWRGEARWVAALAWPVAVTNLNWTIMHLTDTAIVGRAGTGELAALAAGRAITFISIVMGLAALSGVLVLVSRAEGAGERRESGEVLRGGALLSVGLGLAAMAALLGGAADFLRLIGVGEALVDDGARVVRAMALAYPSQFLLCALAYFLEGCSRPRRVMAINVAMLPVNALLAWAWVGGHGPFSALGATGAALATAVTSLLGALAALWSVWAMDGAGERGVRDVQSVAVWRRAASRAGRLLRFGLAPAAAAGLEMLGFSWLIVLSTRLGAETAAAFQTVFSFHNFLLAVGIGFGSAAGVRVGNAVGEGAPARVARRRAGVAAALAVLTALPAAAGLLLFAEPLVALFTDDPAVIAAAAPMLRLLSPFIAFDALQIVLVYALRSLGDQVAAGAISIFAFLGVQAGLGAWLVSRGGGGEGLIWATGIAMAAAAALQGGRFAAVSRRPLRS